MVSEYDDIMFNLLTYPNIAKFLIFQYNSLTFFIYKFGGC